jgi:hypothetical protein
VPFWRIAIGDTAVIRAWRSVADGRGQISGYRAVGLEGANPVRCCSAPEGRDPARNFIGRSTTSPLLRAQGP